MVFPVLCVLFMAMGIVVGMWTFAYVFNDQPYRKQKIKKKKPVTEPVPDQTIGISDEYYSQFSEEEAARLAEKDRRKQTDAYTYTQRRKEQ